MARSASDNASGGLSPPSAAATSDVTPLSPSEESLLSLAAEEFLPRLIRWVESRLSGSPRTQGDAPDAAQSAVRTILRRRLKGQVEPFTSRNDLERLLTHTAYLKACAHLRKNRRMVSITRAHRRSSPAHG